MRGYQYAALGWFAAAAVLAAGCPFPTSGETSGPGGAAGSTSGTTTTTTSTSTSTSTSSSGTGGGIACQNGQTQPCYGGPSGTEDVGICKGGTQACAGGTWGECSDTQPQPEDCASGKDQDCDGTATKCTGTPVWGEVFGAVNADFVNGVAIDSKGDVIVTGGFSDTVNFAEPGASMPVNAVAYGDGGNDIFVAKYTSAGKLVWVQAFGGQGDDVGTAVAVDANDDVIVAGHFYATTDFRVPQGSPKGAADGDAFVLKLNGGDGTTVWVNAYGDIIPTAMTPQRADGVAVDASGNVAVVGNFDNTIDFGGGHTLSSGDGMQDYDGYVLVLDSGGNYKWSQGVHGDAGTYPAGYDWLRGVAFDGIGDVLVTGVATGGTVTFGGGLAPVMLMPPPQGNHIVVAKYDPTGTAIWGQAIGNDNPPNVPFPRHQGNAVAADANGNVVVTGSFVGTIAFPMGSMLMAKGTTDVFVVKLDPSGKALWSKSWGGGGADVDVGSAVALDQFGNVVVVGSFQHKLDLGMPTTALTAKGMTDAFAFKLTSAAAPLWSQAFAANGGDTAYPLGVAVDREPTYVQGVSPPGAPVVGGQFGNVTGGMISFGLAGDPRTSAGTIDMFLARLAP